MAKLDNVGVHSAMGDAAGAGYSKVDSTRMDSAGVNSNKVSKRTREDDRPRVTKKINMDIVTIEYKTPILVSS